MDTLFVNGTVVDGTGAKPRRADVGIQGDRIVALGDLGAVVAGRVIDCAGLVVCPGFIDTHVHSDLMLLAEPLHEEGIRQGITTEVLGQDGLSYAPLSPENLALYRRYLVGLNGNPDLADTWSTVQEFRALFDRRVGPNTAYCVPHGAVRLEVAGMRDVPLNDEQLARAKALVRRGFEEGAVGFSTGLDYYPCNYSTTDELVSLCETAAEAGGVYLVHLRGPGRPNARDGEEEALEVCRRSGVALHFSHYGGSPQGVEASRAKLAPIERAMEEGLDITLELYPYPYGSSQLLWALADWANEDGPDALLQRLRDERTRAALAQEIDSHTGRRSPIKGAVLTWIRSEKNAYLTGWTAQQAAASRGQTLGELVCSLLLEEELAVGWRAQAPEDPQQIRQFEDSLLDLFGRPYYMLGSDSIHVGAMAHPRGWGAFPRMLRRFWRELRGLPLETFIERMTGIPARRFGLRERGVLAEGSYADLVVFDPENIAETNSAVNPRSYPEGIPWVMVNGTLEVDEGKTTGALAGRALARG